MSLYLKGVWNVSCPTSGHHAGREGGGRGTDGLRIAMETTLSSPLGVPCLLSPEILEELFPAIKAAGHIAGAGEPRLAVSYFGA